MSTPALWAPAKIRWIFEDARLNERCFEKHAPRLVRVGGDAWVAACGWGVGPCRETVSLLYRLGRWSEKRAVLRIHANGRPVADTIARAVPCPIDPAALCRGSDLRMARCLGVDRWGVAKVGKVFALVGFAGAFKPSLARAVMAPNDTTHEQYANELRAIVLAGRR